MAEGRPCSLCNDPEHSVELCTVMLTLSAKCTHCYSMGHFCTDCPFMMFPSDAAIGISQQLADTFKPDFEEGLPEAFTQKRRFMPGLPKEHKWVIRNTTIVAPSIRAAPLGGLDDETGRARMDEQSDPRPPLRTVVRREDEARPVDRPIRPPVVDRWSGGVLHKAPPPLWAPTGASSSREPQRQREHKTVLRTR